MNQLEKITNLVGCPPKQDIGKISPFAATMLEQLKGSAGYEPPLCKGETTDGDHATDRRFSEFFKKQDGTNASADAIDLLVGLLHFDPSKRTSAVQALAHPYISQFHDPSVERDADRVVKPSVDDDEKKSTNFYREKLYAEIKASKDSLSMRSNGPQSNR